MASSARWCRPLPSPGSCPGPPPCPDRSGRPSARPVWPNVRKPSMSCAHMPNRLRNRGIEQVITLVRRLAARIPAKTEDIMKLRASIAAIGTAVALGGTGAFLLPTAANAHAMTHTLRFTAVQQATANFSKTIGGAADKDVNKAGKVIGYDVLRVSFKPKTNTTTFGIPLETKSCLLDGAPRDANAPVNRGQGTSGT